MEGLVKGVDSDFWAGRRVLVTGHTGFKGSWLCLYLELLGAKVYGYSLAPPTQPNLFTDAHAGDSVEAVEADVTDLDTLRARFRDWRPEVVFHLAAQPLVRESYLHPIATYRTNVMGTANVLEACRGLGPLKAVVIVTSDKCYDNRERDWGYREFDRLGGADPYSTSKACAELVTTAYRASFFNPSDYAEHGLAVASTRAGNVLGGGDWAAERLVPDAVRAWVAGQAVRIRYPDAVRPWQYVLEPLRGYLMLAERLSLEGPDYGEAWNFGPADDDAQPVRWVLERLGEAWPRPVSWHQDGSAHPHEAGYLKLDSSKAKTKLGWRPVIGLEDCLRLVSNWYAAYTEGRNVAPLSREQVAGYVKLTSQDERMDRV